MVSYISCYILTIAYGFPIRIIKIHALTIGYMRIGQNRLLYGINIVKQTIWGHLDYQGFGS